MHRIEIRNFGPIKHFEAEINDLMFFIGAQASGKSTISKIIFFCRSLGNELLNYPYDKDREIQKQLVRDHLFRYLGSSLEEYFGKETIKNLTTEMEVIAYFSDQATVRIIATPAANCMVVKVIPDERMVELLSPILEQIRQFQLQAKKMLDSQELLMVSKIFSTNVTTKLSEIFTGSRGCFFIPSGRSAFSTFGEQLRQSDEKHFDRVTRLFLGLANDINSKFTISLAQLIKNKEESGISEDLDLLLNFAFTQMKTILKGRYRYEIDPTSPDSGMGKIYYAKHSRDKYVSLSSASSGQQEVIWILCLLFKLILDDVPTFNIIEEPEAHLFPETQNQLVEFLGLFANAKPDNQLLVTTHSPYILTALNNLIYAYQVGQKNPEEVNTPIPKQFWIDPRRVSAYFVENGYAHSIMDEELQQIKAEEIDNASTLTNNLYDQLLDIKVNGKADDL